MVVVGCRSRPESGVQGTTATPSASGSAAAAPASSVPQGLTAEQAAQVLAKVGDQVITVGDYAATLERMGQFDQLRYQSPERRRELLDAIIDMELLARDARDRGLDKKPETEESIRQILREALLDQVRNGLPTPDELPAEEVRVYYDAHRGDFHEPERRRVAHVLVRDRATAEKVLAEAKGSTQAQFGELVAKYSIDATRVAGAPALPAELAGDLGIVSAPGEARGTNARVPEPVRAAVFALAAVGDVADQPIRAPDGWHIVRMTGKTEPRDRTLADAERTVRVALLQAKIAERERALEAELRRKFPIVVDERALSAVALPPKDEGRDAGASALPTAPR
jgi:parvulin-like peptidyl-prolyl isomerase